MTDLPQTEKIHDKGDIVVSLQIHCLDDEYYLTYRLPMEGGTRTVSYDEYKKIIDTIRGQHLNHTAPCKACYGKKGYSVFHQDNSKDDFTGKDVGKGKSWTTIETCPRCAGTGEEPKVEASKQEERDEYCKEHGHEIYSDTKRKICFCRHCGKEGQREDFMLNK